MLTILYYISTAAQIFIPDFLYRGLEKMEGVTTRYIIAKLVSAVLILVTVRNDDVLLLVPVAYLTGTVVAGRIYQPSYGSRPRVPDVPVRYR